MKNNKDYSDKPIIDHQGAYVTEPNVGVKCYGIGNYSKWKVINGAWGTPYTPYYSLMMGDVYATREAAEMALIRAKCIQRLKVRQHNTWLPERVNPHLGYEMINSMTGGMGIYLPSPEQRYAAHKDMSEFEREAFSYIYKPE